MAQPSSLELDQTAAARHHQRPGEGEREQRRARREDVTVRQHGEVGRLEETLHVRVGHELEVRLHARVASCRRVDDLGVGVGGGPSRDHQVQATVRGAVRTRPAEPRRPCTPAAVRSTRRHGRRRRARGCGARPPPTARPGSTRCSGRGARRRRAVGSAAAQPAPLRHARPAAQSAGAASAARGRPHGARGAGRCAPSTRRDSEGGGRAAARR